MSGYRLFRDASRNVDKDVALICDKVELKQTPLLVVAYVQSWILPHTQTYIISLRQCRQIVSIALHARDKPIYRFVGMESIFSIKMRPSKGCFKAFRVHPQRSSFSIPNRALGVIPKL